MDEGSQARLDRAQDACEEGHVLTAAEVVHDLLSEADASSDEDLRRQTEEMVDQMRGHLAGPELQDFNRVVQSGFAYTSAVAAQPAALPMLDAATGQKTCPNCGRPWGTAAACQFCGQFEGLPLGVRLSSPARRLGAYALDFLLAIVTLFIGWLVWMLIVWGRGQTPGKQILGMYCVRMRTGTRANWGTMFVRDFLCKTLVFGFLVVTVTFGLGYILYFWLVWDSKNQELWDKMANTIVVDDPQKALAGYVAGGAIGLPQPDSPAPAGFTV